MPRWWRSSAGTPGLVVWVVILQARVLETAIGVVVGLGVVVASAVIDRRVATRRAQLRELAARRVQDRRAGPELPPAGPSQS